MKLSDIFDSTSGKGISKKIVVLFITGTVLPLLEQLGFSHDLVVMLGQLAAIYLGGQSIADAAKNYSSPVVAVPAAAPTVEGQ